MTKKISKIYLVIRFKLFEILYFYIFLLSILKALVEKFSINNPLPVGSGQQIVEAYGNEIERVYVRS
jgi:hypothetical protein